MIVLVAQRLTSQACLLLAFEFAGEARLRLDDLSAEQAEPLGGRFDLTLAATDPFPRLANRTSGALGCLAKAISGMAQPLARAMRASSGPSMPGMR